MADFLEFMAMALLLLMLIFGSFVFGSLGDTFCAGRYESSVQRNNLDGSIAVYLCLLASPGLVFPMV